MRDEDELVYVVAADVINFLEGQMYSIVVPPEMMAYIDDHGVYRPRSVVETDPAWKQIIPYVIIEHGGEVFRYARRDGDPRLKDLYSIGVGGHLKEEDIGHTTSPYDRIMRGAMREMDEEFRFDAASIRELPIAAIYDSRNAVGRVHLGLVYLAQASSAKFSIKERGTFIESACGFVRKSRLREGAKRFEGWTDMILRYRYHV